MAAKKDDVYYNIAKLIYGYQLSKPETTYKDWTYDTALKNLRQAMAIDPLPVYTQLEGDILFAQQDYAGALAAYEKVNASNLASAASFFSAAKTKELLKADAKEVCTSKDFLRRLPGYGHVICCFDEQSKEMEAIRNSGKPYVSILTRI